MKAVCIERCQVRIGKHIKTCAVDEVVDIKERHPCFKILKAPSVIDFATAEEAELLEAEYDLDHLRSYIEKTFDKKPGNRGKEKLVEMLLDYRFRLQDDVPPSVEVPILDDTDEEDLL